MPTTAPIGPGSGFFAAQWRGGAAAMCDWRFYAAMSLGCIGWALPEPGFSLGAGALLFKAFAEELFFRAAVQEWLQRLFSRRGLIGPVSAANAAASALFAAAHLFTHPPLWAAAVFFPGLVFGWAWDRFGSVAPPWLLHFFYNYCLFFRPW